MNLVKCKFLDENKIPKGKEYIYEANEDFVVGEVVSTQDNKEVLITETDVPQDAIKGFEDNLKFVKKTLEQPEEIIIDEVVVINLPEINKEELIIVEQLPIITERLKLISDEIDFKIAQAKSLECTGETVKIIKTMRAGLTKDFAALEENRKKVKKAVLTPYDQFEAIYKQYVTNKYNQADSELRAEKDRVESARKIAKENEVKAYFTEYLMSKNIDFITYEKANINVTLSASMKSLKEQAKSFIDRVSDDIALIETQENKEEIFVEYKKTLNCSQAITAVTARHKAIEEQKMLQVEQEERRKAQQEAIARIEAVTPFVQPLDPPKIEKPLKPKAKFTVAFKVSEAKEKLSQLIKFLNDNEIEYIQIPLKNIIESEAI